MPSAAETVAATAPALQDIGAIWMLHPDTAAYGEELGYPKGWAFYFAGRGGALGDVDVEQVRAAFGYFNVGFVEKMWERGTGHKPGPQAALDYQEACARFGRKAFTEGAGLDDTKLGRLAQLAGKIAEGVEPDGLPLFVAWRRLPVADDPAGQALQRLNVLRELRGSLHLCAVVAAGLTPLEAMIAGSGEDRARAFGHRDELPEITDDTRARRQQVEATTDALEAAVLERTLNDDERAEFVTLVAAAEAAVRANGKGW